MKIELIIILFVSSLLSLFLGGILGASVLYSFLVTTGLVVPSEMRKYLTEEEE
jgi:hypothetical protein